VKTRTDLLDICFSLGISADEESFYRFAHEYILGIIQRGSDKSEFFNIINYCCDNSENPDVLKNVGISGNAQNGASIRLANWCKNILGNSEIAQLDISELNILMGYCSRQAKIKENGL